MHEESAQEGAPGLEAAQVTPFISEAFREAWFSGLRLHASAESINAAIPELTGDVDEGALAIIRCHAAEERAVLYTMPGRRCAFLLDLGQGVWVVDPALSGCDAVEAARCVRLFITEAFINLECFRLVCCLDPADATLAQALTESGFRHQHTLPSGQHMALNLDDWIRRVGARWYYEQCAAVGTGVKGARSLARYALLDGDWLTLSRAHQDFGISTTEQDAPAAGDSH